MTRPSSGRRIAFIGAGRMGAPMILRLLAASHSVTICDPHSGLELAGRTGAGFARTPREAVTDCDLAILCLPSPAVVDEVLFGTEGIFAGADNDLVVLDFSTTSPDHAQFCAVRAADLGGRYIDCPIIGADVQAEQGTVVFLAGIEPAGLNGFAEILALLSQRVHCMGAPGSGQAAKLVINMAAGCMNAGFGEGAALFSAFGGDFSTLASALSGIDLNRLAARILRDVRNQTFEPGFKIELMRKDMWLATQWATSLGIDVTVSRAALSAFDNAIACGHGNKHVSAVALRSWAVAPGRVRE